MSDLDRFELFTQVALRASLTQAAEALGMSKAALSKQIRKLENDLRIDLFDRKGQRLQLTTAGQMLLTQCLRLQKELDDARSLCQQFHQEPEGELRVVCFYHFAYDLIFDRLEQFLERYPRLQCLISLAERLPDFDREQIDLAIGFSVPMPNDEIVRREMTTTRYTLCASPGYIAKHGPPSSLEQLAQHRYIEHRLRMAPSTLKLKAGYQASLKPWLILDDIQAMIECAVRGLGLVQLPCYLTKDLIEAGKLVEVLRDYQQDGAGVYYFYPKYRYVQPKVRKFIDYFLTR
jgi:DNA-binding transcriptional LysR family regulator